ncbi:MAG: hypothetical protein RIQ89_2228 [Bacteroidota bacterium]|jgi:hypothetical protein
MKKRYTFLIIFLFNFISQPTYAQDAVIMADTMRSEGKIYVVVGAIVIILGGLFTYLVRLDRKVNKLKQ